jgi:hypothetical protein
VAGAVELELIEDNILVFIGGERIGFVASFHLIEGLLARGMSCALPFSTPGLLI